MAHTLLLADDSVTIQRVIELTFADEDVRVVAVSDGDEAIAVLDKTPPDIVLADVGMPGRTGYEVADHVKRTPKLAHIPVVLLTGAFEKIDEKKAATCDGVLNKPFEPQLVIGRVKELLARPKQAAPKIAPPPPTPAAAAKPDPTQIKTTSVDNRDYFDRLDRAFANLSTEAGGTPRSIADAIDYFATHSAGKPAAAATATTPDRLDAAPPAAAPAVDIPLSPPAPAPAKPAAAVAARPVEVTPPPQPKPVEQPQSRPSPPPVVEYAKASPPPAFPPLADAFAALLAAEQSSPSPNAAPLWPASAAAPATISDEVIEQVVRRVLDRMSDRVIRETVGEKVAAVAERLVREEIDRIKAALK